MEETGRASAYGAALAGAEGFNFLKFIRQPHTIVRFLSWIFCIVVFGCITTEGYINTASSAAAKCIFNNNDSACEYAVGIGVIGFLACVVFLMFDVYLPHMSNAQERKYTVMADLGFSGAWTFLWFVCFCLLTNQWNHTKEFSGVPEVAARATIAFSFFSIATWGILTYFALCRFRRGVNEAPVPTYTEPSPEHTTPYPPTYAPTSYNPTTYTPTSYNPTTYNPTTYTAYPDMNEQPAFKPNIQAQPDDGYQPPNY